jgi:uncharacterized membrane-anchored protein YhcB (DUF1043 family)
MMGGASFHDHEVAVEESRAKLTQDLAALCSSETLAAFTDDLKKEAFDTKDALWEKIKARAASNPAAVIAIGTGLVWRLIQRPPIASALIGVGLFSLWKTTPRTAYDAMGNRLDYVQQSKESFKEQAGQAFAAAANVADKAQEAATAKGTEVWETAKGKMQGWQEAAGLVVGELKSSGDSVLDKVKSSGDDLVANTRAKESPFRNQIDDLAANAAQKRRDDDTRNSLLLGIAGAAIAAALGIACQKRIAEIGTER